MADISQLPFRSTPFTGDPSLVQPVLPNQIFHSTDTSILYIANSLTLGDISPYGGAQTGGGGGSAIIPGYMVCQCNAPYYHTKDYSSEQSHRIGGKAIRILENGTHSFNIKISSEFVDKLPTPTEITNNGLDANKIIEVHRWSQPPNGGVLYNSSSNNSSGEEPQGRVWVADLPVTGGTVDVTIDGTFKWISVTAKNFDNSNNASYPNQGSGEFDTPYVQWFNTSDIWLWTFTDGLDLSQEINATDAYDSSIN